MEQSPYRSMLVERSMLTMRIERSICPLTMLVESSMLTMRIERSICPLTRWMFATILVRRRLWSFLERLNLSQYWTLYRSQVSDFQRLIWKKAVRGDPIRAMIPPKMPGMWGLAKTAASLTSWLLKNKGKPGFRQELKSVVAETLSDQRMIA